MGSKHLLYWIRVGGTALCLLLGVANAIGMSQLPKPPGAWRIAAGVALHGAYALLFRVVTRDFPDAKPWHIRALTAQIVLGALLNSELAVINALTIPLVLSRRRWTPWLGALILSLVVGFSLDLYRVRDQLAEVLRTAPSQIFLVAVGFGETLLWIVVAFFAAILIARIEANRRDLAALNAELVSSRALLAESSRLAERLRIARELHDSIGHHLTTLNMSLEICRRLPPPEKDAHIEKAQFLARLLLADIRDVVSSWRSEESVALPDALKSLGFGASGVEIEFDIEPDLPSPDPAAAHAILRCAQEAVTNALRHASATKVAVSLRRRDDRLALTVVDNGRGCQQIVQGNGLSGIADRATERNGRSWVESHGEGKGFTVHVEIPLQGAVA